MTPRIFSLIAAAVFLLIALGYPIRLLFGWHVTVENMVVPVWISWIGLAYRGVSRLPGLPVEQIADEVPVGPSDKGTHYCLLRKGKNRLSSSDSSASKRTYRPTFHFYPVKTFTNRAVGGKMSDKQIRTPTSN